MSLTAELQQLDLRFEGYRLRNHAREARLLASITVRGIEQPLKVVEQPTGLVLLDGFKRLRCARQIPHCRLPYQVWGQDEAAGIVQLLGPAPQHSLNILEQAKFVVELLDVHGLSLVEVAECLARGKSWVSLRHTLLREMSGNIQAILLRGEFPVYAYMHYVRPFLRRNGVTPATLERFVRALARQNRSVRDIQVLARAYFRGSEAQREAIDSGKHAWLLQQLRDVAPGANADPCRDFERSLLDDLRSFAPRMAKLAAQCQDPRPMTPAFLAQAQPLVLHLLSQFEPFSHTMREFHDQSRQA